jgi:hypothetical protein
MTDRIFVLEMEHPFDGCPLISLHKTKLGADTRAAELVNLILPELFAIFEDLEGFPEIATPANWEELEDRYSNEDWVQDDNWGRWGGSIFELELEE